MIEPGVPGLFCHGRQETGCAAGCGILGVLLLFLCKEEALCMVFFLKWSRQKNVHLVNYLVNVQAVCRLNYQHRLDQVSELGRIPILLVCCGEAHCAIENCQSYGTSLIHLVRFKR